MAAVAFVLAMLIAPAAQHGPTAPQVFHAQGCPRCHSVDRADIAARPGTRKVIDLSGVGAQHDRAWFKKWLRRQVEARSRVDPRRFVRHPAVFRGDAAALHAMADWLCSLQR